jgi:hypothetical protein
MAQAFEWAYLWRVLLMLGMNAAVAAAAWRAAQVWFARAHRSERLLAAGVLFFAQIVLVTGLLGFLGLVSLPVFAAAALALFTGSRYLKHPEKIDFDCLETGERLVETVLPPVKALLVLAGITLAAIALWGIVMHPPPGGDGYIYHLYFPATWLQQARITYVDLPYGVQAATYYPLNTELFYLWLMLPVHDDFITNAAQFPALILGAVCVFALARRARASRNGALAGACLAVLIPGFAQQAGVARVDLFFSLWFLAALYFLYAWNDDKKTAQFIMAGICWGLFLGTKSLAAPYSLLLFLPFVWFLGPQGPRRAFASAVAMGLLLIAFGGFWYIRNALITGNPFYPLQMEVGGMMIFPGAYGKDAMALFHASGASELGRITDLFLGRWLGLFLGLCWMWAGIQQLIGLITGKKNTYVYLFIVPAAVFALFWWVNPHNNLTNGRFLFPGFVAACVVAGLVVSKKRTINGQVLIWAGVAAVVAAGFRGAGQGAPASDHVFQMWRSILQSVSGRPGLLKEAAPAFLCLGAGMCLAGLAAMGWRRAKFSTVTRFSAVLLVSILFVAGLSMSWTYQRQTKYIWLAQAGVAGQSWYQLNAQTMKYYETTGQPTVVASVGNERAYALFGTRLHNRVLAVNVDSHSHWHFHDYHSHYMKHLKNGRETKVLQNERPQYHRINADCGAWMSNLESAGVQLVFSTTLSPVGMQFMEHTADGFPVEVEWMRQNPDRFRLVWSVRSPVMRRVPGTAAAPVAEAAAIYAFIPQ